MQPGQPLPGVWLLLLVLRGPRQHLLGHQGQRDGVHLQDNIIINSDINNKVHVVLPGLHTQKEYPDPDTKTKTERWEEAFIYFSQFWWLAYLQIVEAEGTRSAVETVSGRKGGLRDIALRKVDNNPPNMFYSYHPMIKILTLHCKLQQEAVWPRNHLKVLVVWTERAECTRRVRGSPPHVAENAFAEMDSQGNV